MIKIIERATGKEFKATRIEGGYEVFTLEGEKYKKLKESTFKKYFKPTGETVESSGRKVESTSKKDTKETTATSNETQELSPEKYEKMIEKIKKMLKLAENNPSMEEGLAAALQAQKLMMKYNIHEDDVTLEEIKDEIGSVFSQQKHNSQLHTWRKYLAVIVSRNFRCKCYMSGKDVVFRGYKQDAQIALDVYMNLYIIGDKLGSKAYSTQKNETGSGKGAYNSFVTGFLKGIEEGFSKQCTALMVVIPKTVEDEWVEFSAGFTKSKSARQSVTNYSAYVAGYAEGKAAVESRGIEAK